MTGKSPISVTRSSHGPREGARHCRQRQKKRRVNLMLDPDVAAELQERENSSAFVNALLREKLGL